MSATVGSTVFDGEPCAGGVVETEDVNIDEAWEVIVWGFVSLIWTEIVFVIAWSGWRRIHTASEETVYMRAHHNRLQNGCGRMSGEWIGS